MTSIKFVTPRTASKSKSNHKVFNFCLPKVRRQRSSDNKKGKTKVLPGSDTSSFVMSLGLTMKCFTILYFQVTPRSDVASGSTDQPDTII